MDTQNSITRRLQILVVDDEELVRVGLTKILERAGHTVVAAAGGAEALGLFQPGRFDLVITDLHMPGMRGNELAAAIKAVAPALPVILITALMENIQSEPSLLKHVDALLGKPFTLESLREAISKVVSNPEAS